MKHCPTCGREISEPATVCESCEAWAAALVDPRPADEFEEFEPPSEVEVDAPAVAAPKAPSAENAAPRRRLIAVAAAVAGVALVGFALLSGRSTPSSNVSAAAAATPTHPLVAAEPAASAPAQTWSTANQASWLGNRRRGAAFELPADSIVRTWFGPIRPSLVVRCTGQTMQAFVYTGSPMKIEPRAEGKTVTVSMDGEPMRTERWPDSDDHDALFAPDAAAFTQRLLRARTLTFGYSPHNSSDVVAQFHVSGLDALIGAASKQCAAPPRR